jgi:hypothetical protein
MLLGSILVALLAALVASLVVIRRRRRLDVAAPAVSSSGAAAGAREPDPRTWLVGVGGPVTGRSWFFGERTITIGRSAQNAIQVPTPEVSRRHCHVHADGDGLRVVDLKSRSGVFVNGARVRTALLRPGDELVVGEARFVYRLGGARPDAMRLWKLSTDETEFPTGFVRDERSRLHAAQ